MLAEVFLMRLRTLVRQPGTEISGRDPRFVPYVPVRLNPPLDRKGKTF